jgi:hypothetical protein
VSKYYRIRAIVEYTIELDDESTPEHLLFYRNDGTFCADNVAAELTSLLTPTDDDCEPLPGVEWHPCLCNRTHFEFVREATPEDIAEGLATY